MKEETSVFFEPAPCGISFRTVNATFFESVNDRPNGIFSCFSVILAKKAVFSCKQVLRLIQIH